MTTAPHREVVNSLPSVLIVGYGHVGQYLAHYFPPAHWVDVSGPIRSQPDGLSVKAPPHIYDYGFLCVPTPEDVDGHCDVSVVRDAFDQWGNRARYWCVKSTVEVGTTEKLSPNACFSPEYYGETLGHPFADPSRETVVILGGPSDVTSAFATLWSLATNSYTRIYQTDSRTAELCKLMENAWIAVKVTFCNEMFDLARAVEVDWHELRELWLADPRVSRSHTYVYPGNRGFGGKCLPKDTANLCAWAQDRGSPVRLLEAAREINTRLREDR